MSVKTCPRHLRLACWIVVAVNSQLQQQHDFWVVVVLVVVVVVPSGSLVQGTENDADLFQKSNALSLKKSNDIRLYKISFDSSVAANNSTDRLPKCW
jgi:hypothetical protein